MKDWRRRPGLRTYLKFVFGALVRGSPLAGRTVERLADLALLEARLGVRLELLGGVVPVLERVLPRLSGAQVEILMRHSCLLVPYSDLH